MAYKRILYEKVEPNIVKVTMNRPEQRNAQDYLMLSEMADAFVRADFDEEVRVIILAGAGKDFSAGHDMSGTGLQPEEVADQPEEAIIAKALKLAKKMEGPEGWPTEARMKTEDYIYYHQALVMRNVSKPTIAMVQGHAIAGGFINACMCDLIVASDDALFQNPVVNRLTCSAVEIFFEPWEFGARKAKEILWTGDSVTAEEAKHYGMVSRVVPRDKLEEATMELARKIARTPPVAASLVKRSVNQTLDLMGQSNSWAYHYMTHVFSHATQESAQMRKAFAEVRQKGVRAFVDARDKDTGVGKKASS